MYRGFLLYPPAPYRLPPALKLRWTSRRAGNFLCSNQQFPTTLLLKSHDFSYMNRKLKRTVIQSLIGIFLCFSIFFIYVAKHLSDQLKEAYQVRSSTLVLDRKGEIISIEPNNDGYYAVYRDEVPDVFVEQLLEAEDRYFYYHLGVNPLSIVRGGLHSLFGDYQATSTIHQQLAKILLNNEQERTMSNKFRESLYAISLELFTSKKEILEMYVNSVYFGESVQGLHLASKLYFGVTPDLLTEDQMRMLIVSIPQPSLRNPFKEGAEVLAGSIISKSEKKAREYAFAQSKRHGSVFEMHKAIPECGDACRLTIDSELTEKIRDAMYTHIQTLYGKKATHVAVAVIKVPENEVLALVGSPKPSLNMGGYRMNMAIQPRPIGSTIKPLLYLKGFEKNLRPYTLVEDREYKYMIGSGFEFYPKNYDLSYRGTVDLHYALSNSLNVPAVKVLEFVGIEEFNRFLTEDLQLQLVQDADQYQLGIALGHLEMDLLSLASYFTIFPNQGQLKPISLYWGKQGLPYKISSQVQGFKSITHPAFTQLVTKILSDRKTGVEQFGMKSSLNLFDDQVAVKTGTSRDYHDSWTLGYTRDFVVGVWVGNVENKPMDEVSGQVGAGKIWHAVMDIMLNSDYNTKKKFRFDAVEEYGLNGEIQYGLKGDDYEKYKNLMLENGLILSPHNGDVFQWEEGMVIPLRAREEVVWRVTEIGEDKGEGIGKGTELMWEPTQAGEYVIEAGGERVKIVILSKDS